MRKLVCFLQGASNVLIVKKIAKGRYGLMKDNYLTTILSIFGMVTIVVLYILRLYGIL
jgi:hypothetical protein